MNERRKELKMDLFGLIDALSLCGFVCESIIKTLRLAVGKWAIIARVCEYLLTAFSFAILGNDINGDAAI